MASFFPNLYRNALELLVKARHDAGLTRAELGARFGQPEASISSYEDGRRLLDPGEFIAIARAIGVDPYALLREAERRN